MKLSILLLFFALFISVQACSDKQEDNTSTKETPVATTEQNNGIHKVEVLEFKDVPQYTYMFVKEDDKEFWIAAPTTKVEKGETVYFLKPMEMRNFTSSALNKTFDSIYFVGGIARSSEELMQPKQSQNGGMGGMTGMASPHGNATGGMQKNKDAENAPAVKVEKKVGELTVADLFEKSADFSGKEITLKGKVTKFLPDIMGKNWIHIQDGTDFNGRGDIVATTKDGFKVGDVVTIKAKLETDIDYGYGYKYDVILQDAVKTK